jgi:hypothetical protein
MKSRGDAIGGELPIGIGQRNVDSKADAGPRHDLAFEGIAVKIHDTGKEKESLCARTVAT